MAGVRGSKAAGRRGRGGAAGRRSRGGASRTKGETGTIRKPWGVPLHVALVFPNRYFVAMSNLGYLTIYALLNRRRDTLCERFVDDEAERGGSGRGGTPRSLESDVPLSRFDVVAFSLPFENDYPAVLRILDRAGIPRLAARRTDRQPLVIAGGKAISANPEPLAPFLDLVVLGEAESILPALGDRLVEGILERRPRAERLAALSGIPGCYLPGEWASDPDGEPRLLTRRHGGDLPPPYPQVLEDLDAHPTISPVVSQETELAGMHLLEVSRGCPRRCRFCLTSWLARQPRTRSLEALLRTIEEHTPPGATIGLIGASLGDVPHLTELCRAILHSGRRFSLSSLRVERFSRELAEMMVRSGQRTLTLAPESGSARLRRAMRKPLEEERLAEAAEIAARAGIRNLKLYYLVGLPGETDEEAEEILRMLKRLGHELRRRLRTGVTLRIQAQVSCLVPKAMTPLQWAPMAREQVLKHRLALLRPGASRQGIRVQTDVPKWALLQGVLARGDRSTARLLAALADGRPWPAAAETVNLNPGFYLHRSRDPHEPLPWDHLCRREDRQRWLLEFRRYHESLER